MTDLTGHTLGRYQVVERLGRGGMADVYKAYQPGLDRYVAIKVMHPHLADQPEFITRFEREARAVAKLRHPNIVQVFDFDVQDERYFMVMEYVEGSQSLKEVLADLNLKGQSLKLPQILNIIAKMADALDYAHRQGMVHRDVKPANILMPDIENPLLGDFGIARLAGLAGLTATNMTIGTPAYMAPELGKGETANEQSDIYALGIVLYECLTGVPPYDADTPFGVILKHINSPLTPPHLMINNLPDDVERIVLKSLAKNPENRYSKAALMRDALIAAANQAEEKNIILEVKSAAAIKKPGEEDRFEALTLVGEEQKEGLAPGASHDRFESPTLIAEVDVEPGQARVEPERVEIKHDLVEPVGEQKSTKKTRVKFKRNYYLVAIGAIVVIAAGYFVLNYFRSRNSQSEMPVLPVNQATAIKTEGSNLVNPQPSPTIKASATPSPIPSLSERILALPGPLQLVTEDRGYQVCNQNEKCVSIEFGLDQFDSSFNFGSASWSPDGRSYVFSACQTAVNCGLYISDLNGNVIELFPVGGSLNAVDPAWSPDGQEIAFHGSGSLYKINFDEEITMLVEGTDINCPTGIAWSPDSQWIAWVGGKCAVSNNNVFTVKREGSGVKLIYNQDRQINSTIAWAPDGKAIVFLDKSGNTYRIELDCTSGTRCTPGSLTNLSEFPFTWLSSFTPQW